MLRKRTGCTIPQLILLHLHGAECHTMRTIAVKCAPRQKTLSEIPNPGVNGSIPLGGALLSSAEILGNFRRFAFASARVSALRKASSGTYRAKLAALRGGPWGEGPRTRGAGAGSTPARSTIAEVRP